MSYVTKDSKFQEAPVEDIHRHTVPYVYREFPRHLYKAGGAVKVVEDVKEKAAALKDGWSLEPVPDEDPAAAPAPAAAK